MARIEKVLCESCAVAGEEIPAVGRCKNPDFAGHWLCEECIAEYDDRCWGHIEAGKGRRQGMNAYEIMRGWDAEAGIPLRSDGGLDIDIPGGLEAGDYEEWKKAIEAGDVGAILDGRRAWGLSPIV